MKKRSLAMIALLGLLFALGWTALVSQQALAQCGAVGAVPVPCGSGGDRKKKPTPTATRVPTATPTPTATVAPAAPASLGGALPAINSSASIARPGPNLNGGPLSVFDSFTAGDLACLGALGFIAFVTMGFVFRPTREALGRILNGNRFAGGAGALSGSTKGGGSQDMPTAVEAKIFDKVSDDFKKVMPSDLSPQWGGTPDATGGDGGITDGTIGGSGG